MKTFNFVFIATTPISDRNCFSANSSDVKATVINQNFILSLFFVCLQAEALLNSR